MKLILATVLAAAALAGCTATQQDAAAPLPRVAPAATDADRAALLGRVQSLEGEWLMKDENGQMVPGVVYKTSSSGSVVREIMVPGSEHEMTNVYHMDGDTLVMTHYCAGGNQPRMRARPSAEPNTVDLKFDSVTNFAGGAEDYYMGSLKLTLIDADHLRQDWTSYNKDGQPGGTMTFDLTRK